MRFIFRLKFIKRGAKPPANAFGGHSLHTRVRVRVRTKMLKRMSSNPPEKSSKMGN